jgi:hypothetical protein
VLTGGAIADDANNSLGVAAFAVVATWWILAVLPSVP